MDTQFQIDSVTLNVHNLNKLKDYYQNAIGLTVLKENDNQVILGVTPNKTLLRLVKVDSNQRKNNVGLYHFALLLESREALGSFLRHLIKHQTPIDGASDHGYSEAIYLTDPEGNGIEVYRDKESSQWEVSEEGTIEGYTIAMDIQGVHQAGKDDRPKLNEKTTMGHVHLHVNDLQETQKFYVDILKMDLKSDYGEQAKFFASGFYHHHVGANTWAGINLTKPQPSDLGLAYYTLSYKGELIQLQNHLNENKVFSQLIENKLTLVDNSGIGLHIVAV